MISSRFSVCFITRLFSANFLFFFCYDAGLNERFDLNTLRLSKPFGNFQTFIGWLPTLEPLIAPQRKTSLMWMTPLYIWEPKNVLKVNSLHEKTLWDFYIYATQWSHFSEFLWLLRHFSYALGSCLWVHFCLLAWRNALEQFQSEAFGVSLSCCEKKKKKKAAPWVGIR